MSRRIREELENGGDRYALAGLPLLLAARPHERLALDLLEWHDEQVYLG